MGRGSEIVRKMLRRKRESVGCCREKEHERGSGYAKDGEYV